MRNIQKAALTTISMAMLAGATVALVLLFGGCEKEPVPLTLKNVGTFEQKLDTAEELELPGGFAGAGIRVSDETGAVRVEEKKDIRVEGDTLFSFVTLYNANNDTQAYTLLLFLDARQAFYWVDAAQQAVCAYRVELPPMSYLDIPVTVDLAPLSITDGRHDLWYIGGSTATVPFGDTEKKFPMAVSALNHLTVGEGRGYWADGEAFERPSLSAQDEIPGGLSSLFQVDGASRTEDGYAIPCQEKGVCSATFRLFYRNEARWQTFLLLDGESVPLPGEKQSVLWKADPDRLLRGGIQIELPAESLSGELLLLTLPVGHDALPAVSERYVVKRAA